MKQIIFLVGLLLSMAVQAQLPAGKRDGGYLSYNDFNNNAPKYPSQLFISPKLETDIWAGNDFIADTDDKDIKGKTIRKELWGIVYKGELYINVYHLTEMLGYAKAEVIGKYWLVMVNVPISPKMRKEIGLADDPQFHSIHNDSEYDPGEIASVRIPLLYDPVTNKRIALSTSRMEQMLEIYPELKKQYLNEAKITHKETLKKYIIKLNELEAGK